MLISSKIGLGTVQFGIQYGITNKDGKTSVDEVEKTLNLANEFGLNILDTARNYGESEEVLGRLHKNRFKIVSKFICQGKVSELNSQVEKTLNALQTKTIYGYLSHRPSEIIDNPEIWKELVKWKERGIIQKIGFSLNLTSEYFALKKLDIVPDLIQIPFNYFDNRFTQVAEDVKESGGEVHARSALLQGLFMSDTMTLSGHFDSVKKIVFELQEKFGNELPASLLKFVCKKDFIDKVIMGVNNHNQLKDNIELLKIAPDLDNLDSIVSEEIIIPSNWKL
jgi:aryl-alcohol dehydrogenase-like predicted oxidoreductase